MTCHACIIGERRTTPVTVRVLYSGINGTNDGVGPVLRDGGSKVICELCSNTRLASESVNWSSDENYNPGWRVSFEIGLHICHVTLFDILSALIMSAHLPVRTPSVRVVPLVIAYSSRSHIKQ